MVSNKLHQEHGGGSKEVERVQNTGSGVDKLSQTNQANQTNLEISSKAATQPSNAEKVVAPWKPVKNIQPHSGIVKFPPTNLAQPKRPLSKFKPEMRSETVHIASTQLSRQQEFDSMETSLAKITCSQRAICSSIDSLV